MVGRLIQQKSKTASGTNGNHGGPESVNIESWNVEAPYTQVRKEHTWWKFSYIPLGLLLMLLFLIVLLPLLDQVDLRTQYLLNRKFSTAEDNCRYELVESIPRWLHYHNSTIKLKSTYEAWKTLIEIAEETIEIGSFYWTLKGWKEYPEQSKQGNEIFHSLVDAGLNRNITIRIAQNKPNHFSCNDTELLEEMHAASVRSLDFDALIGEGVLHTKFWIVDRKHLYIGSANMDWRALTEVKELGIVLYNCSKVAEDLAKIFDVYWMLGNQTKLPSEWPDSLKTIYNSENPFLMNLNGQMNSFYITSSPPQLSPEGRNDDLDGLLKLIRNAKKFIHISVMDYMPAIIFGKKLRYWPVIDEELRKAVIDRQVQVRILMSKWSNTRKMEIHFLNSLAALNRFTADAFLEVKLFIMPNSTLPDRIPYTRVNHNKYMVTDNGALIGTSNWQGDYFTSTAGVSFISNSIGNSTNSIQEQLKNIFDRDWNSKYATEVLMTPTVITVLERV